MKMIKTVEELKKEVDKGRDDFFISLGGVLRSSKNIFWCRNNNKFHIHNEIDDTCQLLSMKDIKNNKDTNIGEAIKKKSFYLNA